MKLNKILIISVITALFSLSSCSYNSNNIAELSNDDGLVYFDYDSAELKSKYKRKLKNKVISWSKANPNNNIVVEGHCDERGTYDYNKKLGYERAETVKNFLVNEGIDSSKIKIISYGESRPIAKGSDEDSWKLNRRAVTLSIYK